MKSPPKKAITISLRYYGKRGPRMQDAIEVYHQGVAHLDRDELDEAIVMLTEAIRLDPKIVAAYNCRGCAYGKKGDFDRAIVDFTDVIRLTPEQFSGYRLRGFAYEKKGEKTKADADFAKAEQLKANQQLA